MPNYVTLLGSENVQSAGHAMERAAREMQSAAQNIDASIQDLKRSMEDWLLRLERLANVNHD